MKTQWFRVTVDYGDDRIRQYKVSALSLWEAEQKVLALSLFTVCASDDVEEYDEYDEEIL